MRNGNDRHLKEQCHRVRIYSAHSKFENVNQTFSSFIFKMASTSGSTHGGKRVNSGRKKKHDSAESRKKSWSSKHKRITLTNNMFEAWKDAKIAAGYSVCSDSDFAGHLLSLEYRRRYEYT